MKKINYLFLSFFFVFAFVSCDEDEEEEVLVENRGGKVIFSAQSVKHKSTEPTPEDITHTIITLENSKGEAVYYAQKLPVYNFNSSFISEPISLDTGEYKLTEFLLTDEKGKVLYVSPKEGSEMGEMAENPLAIPFSVKENENTQIVPEVLSVTGRTPDNFGYVAFGFEVVETIEFLINASIYNTKKGVFELTKARIEVKVEGKRLHRESLSAETNYIEIKGCYEEYEIKVSKSGYKTYKEFFSEEELKNYLNEPIEVLLNKKK